MMKLLGSNPVSIATTITGLIVVICPLIEQYQAGSLSPWMLAAAVAGVIFARCTDEDWISNIKSKRQ